MILLDTDHVSVLVFPAHSRYPLLMARMGVSADDQFATSIVSVEEQVRGWMALINQHKTLVERIPAYDRFASLLEFLSEWEVVRLDVAAANKFEELRSQRIRIGTQDLKIASIALVNDALLLSANLRDFQRVPGLRVESWIG